MTIEFSSATSFSQAVGNVEALRRIRTTTSSVIEGVDSPALGGGITAGRFVEPIVTINIEQARVGLAGALTSGNGIRDALAELIGRPLPPEWLARPSAEAS